MDIVGLRELRQDASGLVRRVEEGEEIVITVSGRPTARLVPARLRHWHSWVEVSDLFNGPEDRDWQSDREQFDETLHDPWARP